MRREYTQRLVIKMKNEALHCFKKADANIQTVPVTPCLLLFKVLVLEINLACLSLALAYLAC